MTRKTWMMAVALAAVVVSACGESAIAPSDDAGMGSAAFARKPSSDPGNPGDNNSCDNNDSGNKTRNSPKDKNQCAGGAPSFTLSFTMEEGLLGASYNPCPQEPFPFSGYGGETIEVCDFGGSSYNLILEGLTYYSVTTAPTGACVDNGGGTWYCTVTASNTVITVTAALGNIVGSSRRLQDPVSNAPKNSAWTWEGVDKQGTKRTVQR